MGLDHPISVYLPPLPSHFPCSGDTEQQKPVLPDGLGLGQEKKRPIIYLAQAATTKYHSTGQRLKQQSLTSLCSAGCKSEIRDPAW
jgi:hypothetical protein